MRMLDTNNVERAAQTNPTLLQTLRPSRNKRNTESCWLNSLTGFKLCATTPNNTHQMQRNATN